MFTPSGTGTFPISTSAPEATTPEVRGPALTNRIVVQASRAGVRGAPIAAQEGTGDEIGHGFLS
jgi:hypothetical protein